MKTQKFKHIYVLQAGTCAGPTEKAGPLGECFDITFDDFYAKEKSYELAERTMLRFACDQALHKAQLKIEDMDVLVGGDLMNQIMTTNYFARNLNVPLIGIYAACATSALAIGVAAQQVEAKVAEYAMAFTSSHFCTAEKQFRYPNEYGIQKPDTTTTTATGAGSVILSKTPSPIAVSSFTVGNVIDWNQTDVNDMGSAMMPAALDTLKRHLADTNRTIEDYDLIATGDLSMVGNTMLREALKQEGYSHVERVTDCGLLLFDRENQTVFSGGSGCACSMLVTLAHLFKKLEEKQMKRILLIATGALLSPIAIQQHDSIPCVAHAICFEAVNL